MKLVASCAYDLIRYLKHSNSTVHKSSLSKYESSIIFHYHVIEKGLTMPEPRIGFGKDKIMTLLCLLEKYKTDGYDICRESFVHAVSVVKEYDEFHKAEKFHLDADLRNAIDRLMAECSGIASSSQKSFSREQFFEQACMAFPDFARSRHSVRSYTSEEIDDEIFSKCAEIAQTSPSACNRQPNRIYVVKDKETIERILSLQSGNKGFGHLASALVVFAGDLSTFRQHVERNDVYLNSGMFAMTFMYALHYHKIGCCALNWSVSPVKDKKLRKILNLPENEIVTMILSCGHLPENFKVASSPRKHMEDVVQFR